jgi:hypothetical protein
MAESAATLSLLTAADGVRAVMGDATDFGVVGPIAVVTAGMGGDERIKRGNCPQEVSVKCQRSVREVSVKYP